MVRPKTFFCIFNHSNHSHDCGDSIRSARPISKYGSNSRSTAILGANFPTNSIQDDVVGRVVRVNDIAIRIADWHLAKIEKNPNCVGGATVKPFPSIRASGICSGVQFRINTTKLPKFKRRIPCTNRLGPFNFSFFYRQRHFLRAVTPGNGRIGVSRGLTWSQNESVVLKATDNELLARFIRANDQASFEALVCRHAPMIMSVCRSMLSGQQDAEDAFQATFLVLSRKAQQLVERPSIAGWLHRTAVYNCLALRRRLIADREKEMNEEPQGMSPEPWKIIADRQEFDLLHLELNRLPERYRNALLLCDIQGHSRADAAERLDVTESSLKASLARGRKMLRSRLVRKGIAMSVLLATLARNVQVATADVSQSLLNRTVQLCQAESNGPVNDSISNSPSHGIESAPRSEIVIQLANQGAIDMGMTTGTKFLFASLIAVTLIATPLLLAASAESEKAPLGTGDHEPTVRLTDIALSGEAKPTTEAVEMLPSQPADQDIEEKIAKVKAEIANQMEKSYALRIKSLGKRSSNLAPDSAEQIEILAEIEEIRARQAELKLQMLLSEQKKRNAIPPASTAPLQPGEVLLIECGLADEAGLNRRVVVQRDHTIALPWVGVVSTKGKTLASLTESLNKLYREELIINDNSGFQVYRESASQPIK